MTYQPPKHPIHTPLADPNLYDHPHKHKPTPQSPPEHPFPKLWMVMYFFTLPLLALALCTFLALNSGPPTPPTP